MVSALGPSVSLDPTRSAHAYRAAYAVALAGSLVSAGLTYVYVGNGARELNPVVRAIIATGGLEAMVLVKTGVIIGCYHGYVYLAPPLSPRLVVGFAWLGSLFNLGDALYDLSVATRVGVPPLADVLAGSSLVLMATALGVALRPGAPEYHQPAPEHRRPSADR